MKNILIIGGILLLLLGGSYYAFRQYTKSFSPETEAVFNQEGLKIRVDYCQPAQKGRQIFGDSLQALVPYGKVWRTGANEATKITFNRDVVFAGKPLKAGVYTLWSIPGRQQWQVVINSETGQWGTQYDAGQDVFRASVNSREMPQNQELFEVSFWPAAGGTDMVLHWAKTAVSVPIRTP